MSCAAGPFVCVPSLLGPSERVSGGTRSASGWLILVVLSLPVRSRVDLFYLVCFCWGPDVPPAREYIA